MITTGPEHRESIESRSVAGGDQDMTADTKKLLDEALQLPPAEREALVGQLFDSLETDDPDAEVAWQKEIEHRIMELDKGDVKPIPWNEARQMIFGDGILEKAEIRGIVALAYSASFPHQNEAIFLTVLR
jgi:putative addiction module component (TIGR02574 family)